LEEYSEEELAQFLNSDESATIDALTTYNKPGGDYAGFYTKTINRYKDLVDKYKYK
jgi:hypothetical protein